MVLFSNTIIILFLGTFLLGTRENAFSPVMIVWQSYVKVVR